MTIEPRVEIVFKKRRGGKDITPFAVKIGDMVLPVHSCSLDWVEGSVGVVELSLSMSMVDLMIIKEDESTVKTTKFTEVKEKK
jgi:hypothetical protein